MPVTLTMPALSPTMEEGTLAKWLVREGDQVTPGMIVAEIETDKATMEYEVPEGGVVAKLLVPEGSANVAVNTPIALLAAEGEDAAVAAIPAAPVASAPVAPPPPVAPAALSPVPAVGAVRIAASPLARRIAGIEGLDLTTITGSGPNGRIVRRDVAEAAAARAATPAQAAPAPAAAARAAPAARPAEGAYPPGSYEVVELDTMRRTIARRLTESKQTVPHFYLRTDIDLDAALGLRAQINAGAPPGGDGKAAWKVSVNDMLIKALAGALSEVPEANVTWDDGCILRHKAADVAVAVALEGGLITPVIRDAGRKSVSAIATQMKDLAARARARKLAPEEYQGGTTSISNLGMFGVTSFDAVINPPQGTILAVGAAERRAVVRDGALTMATMMSVTLSVDHRSVDGALGAQLLAAFKRRVEQPLAMLA